MIASSRSYAIGRVHFQIAGGWRMLWAGLGLYLLVLGIGAALYEYYELGDMPRGIPLSAVLTLMMALEGIVLVVLGGMRVSSSIRTDLSTRMIESHRLMPVPAWRAVLGYLFGSTSHAIAFAVVNLLATVVIGAQAGESLKQLIINHAVLLAFAAFVWSIAAVGTFFYRNIFFVALGVVVFGTCTNLLMLAYMVFPAFALLLTPFIGGTAFSFSTTGTADWKFLVAILGQAGFFTIFFIAVCRRYRGSYATTFTVLMALGLVALWAGLTVVGIRYGGDLQIGRMFMFGRGRRGAGLPPVMPTVQTVAGIAACALMGLMPLWSLVQRERQGRVPLPWRAMVWIVLALLCVLPGFGDAEIYSRRALWLSLWLMGAHVLTVYFGLRLLSAVKPFFAGLIGVGGLLLLWAGPMVLETLHIIFFHPDNTDGMGVLATLSPMGLLVNVWNKDSTVTPYPGLVWQWLIVGMLVGVSLLVKRGKNAGGGNTSAAGLGASAVPSFSA